MTAAGSGLGRTAGGHEGGFSVYNTGGELVFVVTTADHLPSLGSMTAAGSGLGRTAGGHEGHGGCWWKQRGLKERQMWVRGWGRLAGWATASAGEGNERKRGVGVPQRFGRLRHDGVAEARSVLRRRQGRNFFPIQFFCKYLGECTALMFSSLSQCFVWRRCVLVLRGSSTVYNAGGEPPPNAQRWGELVEV